MPAELDFLGMPDELFGNETPDEIQGSMERLESLLFPVEDGLDSLLKLSELSTETEVSLRVNAYNDGASQLPQPAKEAPQTILLKERLKQSVETISRLRTQDFMDLLHQYAIYASDPHYEFDQFICEPSLICYAFSESLTTGEVPAPHYGEDGLVRREETPVLTAGESTRPPSEAQLSTPEDGNFPATQRTQGIVEPNQEEQTNASGPSAPRPSRTKRKRDSHAHNSDESNINENHVPLNNSSRSGKTANAKGVKKVTVKNSLSTEFVTYRFGITPIRSGTERWECPFPAKNALPAGRCHADFDAMAIRSHVIDHINAYTGKHPHSSTLECPFRTAEKGCSWKPTGSNTGLPRHVVDVHLKSNAYKCPCGTRFARGSRDQFVRHLRDGHKKNLALKRKTDPTVPGFVDIDDLRLVDEEKQWLRSKTGHVEEEEDDRGEGSSKGVKRARRF